MNRRNSRWNISNISMPRNTRIPGDAPAGGVEPVEPGDMVRTFLLATAYYWRETLGIPYGEERQPTTGTASFQAFDLVGRVIASVSERLYRLGMEHRALSVGSIRTLQMLLHGVSRFADATAATYSAWHSLDFALAVARGMLVNEIREDSDFEAEDIEKYDFRDWLELNGLHASSKYTVQVNLIYHAAFSYSRGDKDLPACAAGSALRLVFQAALNYKGAAYYKLGAGMGETVFVPMYRALKARGVKFRFFHRATAYRLDPTKQFIERIEMDVQAKPIEAEYDPLIRVKDGVLAFPSEPITERLQNPSATIDRSESYFDTTEGEQLVLRHGEDFDQVIAATPVATLRVIAKELINARLDWRNMTDQVHSVQTVSAQIWFNRTIKELGWKKPAKAPLPYTLLSLYWKPVSTFCTMDQTLRWENWGEQDEPKSVVYITGVQKGPEFAPAAGEHVEFELTEHREAEALSRDFVRYFLAEDLLPDLIDKRSPPSPDWNKVYDPDGREASARFLAQYYRSNNDPSARCTLAEPGKTRFRMRAGESGFANLVLAGDWIRNGVNCACMEGAFRSGLQAAEAVIALNNDAVAP
jgi:uncharacterized protein with NAD-binding domain and iron-sulfur cluster